LAGKEVNEDASSCLIIFREKQMSVCVHNRRPAKPIALSTTAATEGTEKVAYPEPVAEVVTYLSISTSLRPFPPPRLTAFGIPPLASPEPVKLVVPAAAPVAILVVTVTTLLVPVPLDIDIEVVLIEIVVGTAPVPELDEPVEAEAEILNCCD